MSLGGLFNDFMKLENIDIDRNAPCFAILFLADDFLHLISLKDVGINCFIDKNNAIARMKLIIINSI